MATAPFTDAEKQRIAFHLGYPAVTMAASVAFGVPVLTQTNWLIYRVLDGLLLGSAVDQLRSISKTMDDVLTKLIEAQDRLAATQLEELHIRGDETDALAAEYRRWGYMISDITGCPVYPYSQRYMQGNANAVTSVPIRRGF